MNNQPSLLDDLGPDPAPAKRRRPKTIPWLKRTGVRVWSDKRARLVLSSCGAMLLLAGGITGFAAILGPQRPDYGSDRIDSLFRYTLLTDEFNRLSVRERAELIGQLVGRVESMSGSDSVLLAAFASSIRGEARDQLIENASLLMVDMIDEQASEYDPTAPKEERVRMLEESIAEMQELFETMAGQDRDITPEERMDEAKAQAKRDMDRVESGEVGARDAGQFLGIMNRTIGKNSSPHQTARGGRLMRDMTRHLRGQDIDTGEPVDD